MCGDRFEVSSKVAVVTAAGSGMGAACARELAERGYRVALMSPSGRAGDLAEELGLEGGEVGHCGWSSLN